MSGMEVLPTSMAAAAFCLLQQGASWLAKQRASRACDKPFGSILPASARPAPDLSAEGSAR